MQATSSSSVVALGQVSWAAPAAEALANTTPAQSHQRVKLQPRAPAGRTSVSLWLLVSAGPALTCVLTFSPLRAVVVVCFGVCMACPPSLVSSVLSELVPLLMHLSCYLPRERSKNAWLCS